MIAFPLTKVLRIQLGYLRGTIVKRAPTIFWDKHIGCMLKNNDYYLGKGFVDTKWPYHKMSIF